MNICILGWYGTETLGDRAILDGLLRILANSFSVGNVFLGSLYPFLTERTLLEDRELLVESVENITIFDVKARVALKEYIQKSDLVIMGGGPLMDIPEMYLVLEGFQIAKKANIKTAIIGCGFGPLVTNEYIVLSKELFNLSDLIILRDMESERKVQQFVANKNIYVLDDPAIISILNYKSKNYHSIEKSQYFAVNFRKYPVSYYGKSSFDDRVASSIVKSLLSFEMDVKLIPMHTFYIGGDDREFLYRIKQQLNSNLITVQSNPLSLVSLYNCFSEAIGCIGMRYHSVVMQTILNGNNLIVNYTGKKGGKIKSFLDMIDGNCFYDNRIIDIGDDACEKNIDTVISSLFIGDAYQATIKESLVHYSHLLREVVYQ